MNNLVKTSIPISALLFFSILVVSPITTASGQVVSVKSDYKANTGETIDISIDMVNAQSIGAMDITLTYDSKVLTATKVSSGTLTGGSIVQGNTAQLGTVTIGIIDAIGFSGNGSLAVITFKVIGSAGEESTLDLSSVIVDIEPKIVSTKNGLFTVTPPPRPVVSIGEYEADTGTTIDISIDMVNAQSIGAMDITLTYDSKVLTATKVSSGTLTGGSIVQGNTAQLGTVTIGIIDAIGFSGKGSIAKITFEVIGKGGDTSSLNLSNVSATDTTLKEVTLTTQNGKISVVCCGICGVTGDLDALMALQMSVGLITVDRCADVNGDGIVTSVDALMILQNAVGLITVYPCLGISITEPVGILSIDVPVGEIRSKFITLKNTGCESLNATISASWQIKDWITFDKTSIEIPPKEERKIRAKIKVPIDQSTGTYTGKLTVKASTPRGDIADTIEVNVRAILPTDLKVLPVKLNEVVAYQGLTTPRTRIIYIENRGSGTLSNVHLDAEGGISECIDFKVNDFSISGYSYKYVPIKVTPPSRAALGEYTTIIHVTSGDQNNETELVVKVIEPTPWIVNPESLNLMVPAGHTYSGVISFTDLSGNSKNVYFDVTGEIAAMHLLSLDKPNEIFVKGKETARLGYNVSVPSNLKNETITGKIVLTGDVNMDIPVTIFTTEPTDYIRVKDQIFSKGAKSQVPIKLSSEIKIGSMDIKLNYDPTVISAINVTSGTLTSGYIIASNLDTQGVVSISLMDINGISGNGSIAIVTFDVIGNVGDKTPLTLSSVEATDTTFNSVALSKLDGTGTIGNDCGVPGDLNGDGKVTLEDYNICFLPGYVIGPILWNICACDVSCDGEVTSVDALMILQASVGNIELKPCKIYLI